ncbi:MAG: hypothetical protein CVU88_03195, partial [Firmicutes bacterium HGW-Firmicutes-13]
MHKMGYLGPRGTFTEEALLRYEDLSREEIKEYKTIPEVIRAIGREVEEGIVPVENSLEGSVNITLDILAGETNLKIKREVISISKGIDYFEYDMYERDDIDEKALNIKIAKYIIRGYVTDDNISDIVGTTSLEQIIYFKYGPIGSKKFSEVRREIMSEQL